MILIVIIELTMSCGIATATDKQELQVSMTHAMFALEIIEK